MRRIAKIAGTCAGLGYAALTGLGKFSNVLGILGLPDEVKGALVLLASAPTIIPVVALIVGLFCAGYLVFDSGHHTLVMAAVKKHARHMDGSQLTVVIGLIVIVAGAATVGIGVWYRPNKIEVRSFGFATSGPPPSPVPQLLPDDGGPIKWIRGYLFGASSSPSGFVVGNIQATGQNESDEFVGPLSGYVRSEITGEQFPMFINDSSGKQVPLSGYGVPARNQFRISVPIAKGLKPLSIDEFLRDFIRFTFFFQYGNHVYSKNFSPDEVKKEMQRTVADLTPQRPESRVGARLMPSKEAQ